MKGGEWVYDLFTSSFGRLGGRKFDLCHPGPRVL
jgi:hypothetical protein